MPHTPRQFNVIIEQDEDGYLVASVPGLPGCHTQAREFGALMERVREAINLCLEVAEHNPQYRRRLRAFGYEPVFVGLKTVEV